MKYKFIPHTADIKFRAFGKNLNEAFGNSALAFSNFVSKGQKINLKKSRSVNLSGTDKESLFYNFLEEMIYLVDAENFILGKADVKINKEGKKAKANFFGDDSANYKGLEHVKAATYSEMIVKKDKDKCVVQCVLDV
ncbi:archease [Candidatus Pacearchaeota archaeon]|nr:archease [Candidatus Pacearchaeota archaeon]